MLTTTDSHSVLDKFSIKVFLDTNILVYLVDDLYLSLNETISILEKCIYVNLISSSFVVFEFIGVRKKEHFLRKILQKNFVKDEEGKFDIRKINLLSVIRYNDAYEADDVSFELIKNDIEKSIEEDLKTVAEKFKVDFEKNVFHSKLFEPAKQLFLSSLISKEDCLVVSSAVWPDQMGQNDNLLFFSNDKDFISNLKKADTKTFFKDKSASPPVAAYLKGAGENNYDLTRPHASDDLVVNIKGFIKSLIKENNESLYIGKTLTCPPKYPLIAAFTLEKGRSIPCKCVITIVSRDLDFFFVSSQAIGVFLNNGKQIEFPFTADEDIALSFELDIALDTDLAVNEKGEGGIKLLRHGGHLVFIHPDSLLN